MSRIPSCYAKRAPAGYRVRCFPPATYRMSLELLPALLSGRSGDPRAVEKSATAAACSTIHEVINNNGAPQQAWMRSLCLCAEASIEVRPRGAPLEGLTRQMVLWVRLQTVIARLRSPAGRRPGVCEEMHRLVLCVRQEVRRLATCTALLARD
jgi:hypothetical protein